MHDERQGLYDLMRVIHPVVYVLLSTANNFSIKSIKRQGERRVKNTPRCCGVFVVRCCYASFLPLLTAVFLDVSFVSSSLRPLRSSLAEVPMLRASFGSCEPPKITRMITRMMTSSGTPNPNM